MKTWFYIVLHFRVLSLRIYISFEFFPFFLDSDSNIKFSKALLLRRLGGLSKTAKTTLLIFEVQRDAVVLVL